MNLRGFVRLEFLKGKQPPALPAPVDLTAAFKDAVFGRFFRSRSWKNKITKEIEWREALYMPGQGWQIVEKTKTVAVEMGQPVIDQKYLKDKSALTFFEAVKNLADHEAAQPGFGWEPVDESEAETLGDKYFVTFAEREAIAFDAYGDPWPTRDGFIIGDGKFPPGAAEKAMAAWMEKKKKLGPLAGPLADFAGFSDIPAASPHFFATVAGIEQMERVLTCFSQIRRDIFYRDTDVQAWFYYKALRNSGWGVDPGERLLHKSMRQVLARPRDFYTGNSDTDGFIAEPLVLFRYTLCMVMAAYTQHHVNIACQHANNGSCTPKVVEAFKRAAGKALSDLGVKQGAEGILYRTFARYNDDFKNEEQGRAYADLDLIIRYVGGLRDFCRKQVGLEVGNAADEPPSLDHLVGQILGLPLPGRSPAPLDPSVATAFPSAP